MLLGRGGDLQSNCPGKGLSHQLHLLPEDEIPATLKLELGFQRDICEFLEVRDAASQEDA